jgi:hypothetical protein
LALPTGAGVTAAPATVARPKANAAPKMTVRIISVFLPAYMKLAAPVIELIHGTLGNNFLVGGRKSLQPTKA